MVSEQKTTPKREPRAQAARWNWSLAIGERCFVLALIAGAPGVLLALFLLWRTVDFAFPVKWGAGLIILAFWFGAAWLVRNQVHSPLLLLSSVLRSFTDGDFSVRLASPGGTDVLTDMVEAVNDLGATLRSQRSGAMEASMLLRSVTDEIDSAMFTIGADDRLTWINRAGEQLLARPRSNVLGQTLRGLGMAALAEAEPDHPVELPTHPGRRWEIKRKTFRESGAEQTLLVVHDLTRTLRREEHTAWQRLVRVLSHEINNSLTPIRSLSACLSEILDTEPKPADWQSDLREGLSLVTSRSETLGRFVSSYARLANLPSPRKSKVALRDLLKRAAALERRVNVAVIGECNPMLFVDTSQMDQALINLVKNAAEASMERGSAKVELSWTLQENTVEIYIRDEGPGLADTQNLFVPFYTTKEGGSGIGLALSKGIVEAHGGSLQLRNRRPGTGCEAVLRLPL